MENLLIDPTECGVNYQLLAVITEAAQWETPSCSQPQPATDNGVRDGTDPENAPIYQQPEHRHQ